MDEFERIIWRGSQLRAGKKLVMDKIERLIWVGYQLRAGKTLAELEPQIDPTELSVTERLIIFRASILQLKNADDPQAMLEHLTHELRIAHLLPGYRLCTEHKPQSARGGGIGTL